ncbi:FG-GAP-like repeat-containing protein, partial [Zooshikella sp. RANM57]|uniref:FG-GAP-like repeat-containing protein n=1 Tax=Zooshikella sp. RANM57 TaxID=3425863 RepID=UPI003D6EF92E
MKRLNIALASFTFFITQLLIPTFATADPPKVVGTIPGSFSVGTDGAANYRISLELPPGVNGLTPNLALEYDSQKGNGLLGIGWRLTGFPTITRCPTTLEQDGFIDGVDFDDNDKYCLNGQRLVAINGSYGASGTEYRTEHDHYKKIISYGTAGHGPAYFQVWYKEGNFIELGSTEDAQVEAQSKPNEVFRWDISKIQDRFGNTVTFHYSEQTDFGEHYPVSIRYANTAINFTLEERPDPILTYVSGVKHLIKQRIKTITIAQDNDQRRYVLNYGTAGRPLKSLLESIQYCTDQCFPATQFSWQRNENTASSFNSASLLRLSGKPYEKDNTKLKGDFNGDGLIDLAWAYSGPQGLDISTALAKGDGTFLSAQLQRVSGTPYEKDNTSQTGDFNGDGLTDIAWMYSSQHGLDVSVALSNGDGSFQQAQLRKLTSTPYEKENTKLTGDFNGDGRTDFAWMYSGPQGLDVKVALSNGDGTFGAPRLKRVRAQGYEKDNTALTGDFNGDGITDIAWMYSSAHGLDITTATALGDGDFAPAIFKRVSTVGYEKDNTKLTGDFNGDGLTDLAWAYAGPLGLDVSVSLAKGDGSFTLAVVKRLNTARYEHDNTALTGDFNGDGMADLAWVYSSQAGLDVTVALGVGDGTFLPATLKRLSGLAYEKDNAKLTGDFNGDGLMDLAWLYSGPSGLDETVALSLEKKPLVSQITNGLGQTTTLTYQPITDKSIFTKSTNSQYPVIDKPPVVYVVAQAAQANGIGGYLTTDYHYQGLKRHLRGVGALGFAEITSTQVETGIKTTDYYLQDVANRKIGLLSRSQTWSATGVLLKDTQQTWQVNTLDDGGIKRFQTHLVSRETQQKSLQDEWLSTLTETFQYDDWGNTTEAKQIIKDALGQQTSATTNTYQNDESNWLIGLATQTQATNVGVSGDSQTRTTQFSYDATTGALTQRIQEPGQGDYVLTTDFKYDSFGNLIEEQTQGAKVATRKQTYTYDAQGRFLTSTTNALGHKAQQTSDAFWGVPLTTTDANGLVTQYSYDNFGRLISQKAPDNTQTTLTRGWCDASTECPAGAVYWVKTQAQGSAPTTVYVDQLERTIRTETLALTGETQYQDTVYNALGQVVKTSLPYFKGDEVYWT